MKQARKVSKRKSGTKKPVRPRRSKVTLDKAAIRRVEALYLLRSPKFYQRFLDAVGQVGLVGEAQNALVVYLFGISRVLQHPLNIFVKGSSSSGKNFLVRNVLRFFPKNCIHEFTSGTGTSWSYQKNNLQHRIVYLQEENASAGNVHPGRLLISESEIVRVVTIRSGRTFKTVREVTKGPVACISTTTSNRLKVDDETRHLSIWTDESPEQTRRILFAQLHGAVSVSDEDLEIWHAVQRLIAERAHLPFEFHGWIKQVVEGVWTGDVRVRRYFPAFMAACQIVALIRSFRFDADEIAKRGKLEIDFKDFAIASLIFNSCLSQSLSFTDDGDRQLQGALAQIASRKKGGGVDATELAKALNISKDRAYARLREATKSGSIRQANQPERANRKIYLPSAHEAMIPDPEEVFRKLGSAHSSVRFVHPITGEDVVYTR